MKNLLLLLALMAQLAVTAQAKTNYSLVTYCPIVPDTTRVTENTIHAKVDTVAQFPGGKEAFHAYFDKNFKTRTVVNAKPEKTRIYVSFVVEKDGSLTDVKVRRSSAGVSINNDVIRILQASPAWKPAVKDGKIVRSSYSIPINL